MSNYIEQEFKALALHDIFKARIQIHASHATKTKHISIHNETLEKIKLLLIEDAKLG